jgi:ATP-binding cassette subfamily F protein uup
VLDAEAALEQCRAETENPKIASHHLQLQEAYEVLKAAEQEVERLYTRWAELEAKQQGA